MIDPLFRRDPSVVLYPDCEGPLLTEEMIAAAEDELGVRLPGSYIDLMRVCNGGYTKDAAFATDRPTSWAPGHVPVDVIFGVPSIDDRGRFGTGQGILQTAYMTSEWGLPHGLVLLNGEGHWWIALDYRGTASVGPPSVAWVDVEASEDLQLADSFETFLDGLLPSSTFLDR